MVLWVVVVIGGAGAWAWVTWALRTAKQATADSQHARKAEAESRQQSATLSAQLEAAKARLEASSLEASRYQAELGETRQRVDQLSAESRGAAEMIRGLETRLEEQQRAAGERLRMQQDLHARQKEEFEGIAAKVLEQNTHKFTGATQERLGQVTAEFAKGMAELKAKVEQAHGTDVRERVALKEQLTRMVDVSHQLDAEAKNLTRALTGDRRAQGVWGEVVLERLLEMCGLREGHEYRKQATFTTDEDCTLRPDVVVQLPGGRAVVVDAKVSLTAYSEYVAAESNDEAQAALQRHVQAVRKHIKTLGGKDYWRLNDLQTGDYVLMFLAAEPAFADALRHTPALFEEAFHSHVILVSPCTLLATLRTIEHTWRVERQNDTARQIIDKAGALHDKFVGFCEDMQAVERGLSQAKRSYDDAFGKLKSGRGNLISKMDGIRKLGVAAKKSLPAALVAGDGELPEEGPTVQA